MSTLHYVDGTGAYIGGFGDGASPPSGAVLVDSAPPSAMHVWDGEDWIAPPGTAARVIAERQRRIDLVADPDTREELIAFGMVLSEKGRDNWTPSEKAAWDAGDAVWAQIKAIRLAAEALISPGPIPSDCDTSEAYWP